MLIFVYSCFWVHFTVPSFKLTFCGLWRVVRCGITMSPRVEKTWFKSQIGAAKASNAVCGDRPQRCSVLVL